MTEFRAFRIHADKSGTRADFERLRVDDLTAGEVLVRVSWSDINYKDALAATGRGKILRRSPLNGGIDLAGEIVASDSPRFQKGQRVAVCGAGLSETLDGGYAEYARLPAESIVPLPAGLSESEAMAIGTAGYTAALAILRMEDMGQHPEMGPILVTGATGGVGSLAIDMLSGLGYEVVALSGKPEQEGFLRRLGAARILDRHGLEIGTQSLEKALWGGAVDSVGGATLSWLTRTVTPWGNIASIGLVGGIELRTTVMPFILRGVSLLGINSVLMPLAVRDRAWQRLGEDLKPRHLDDIVTRTIAFDELPSAFDDYLEGRITGRTVVRIGP